MADQNYEILTKIGWQSDDAALRQTSGQLEDLAKKALGVAAAYLSVREAVQFMSDAFRGAVEDQKLFTQLTQNAQLYGHATREVAAGLREWIEDLQKVSAINKDQLIPAMNQAMSVTGSVTKAQQLMEIAAGAAARGVGTLEGNVTTLARAFETGNIRGVGPFQNLLREAIKTTGDMDGAIESLGNKFGDAGASIETAAIKIERSKVAFRETKDAIGELVLTGGAAGEGSLLYMFSYFLGLVAAGLLDIYGVVSGVAKGFYDIGSAIAHTLIPGMVDFKKAWQDLGNATKEVGVESTKFAKIGEDMLGRIDAAWNKHTSTLGATGSALDKLASKMSMDLKKLADDADVAEKRMEKEDAHRLELLNKGAEEQIRLAKKVADAEEKYIDDVRAANERLNKEDAARSQQEETRTITAAQKIEKIERDLAGKKKNIGSQELRAKIEELEQEYEIEKAYIGREEQLERYIAALKIQVGKTVTQEKLVTDAEAVASSLDSAGKIFGNNKALAIASAIVHAFAAAAGASAETHGDVYTRIAAYLATLAEVLGAVTSIGSTNFGSSGGASIGGGGGVAMPPMVYTGAPTGTASASTTTVQSTVNQPSNVTINTLTGDGAVATARQVQRILRPGSRAYDRGVVNRQALTVGTVRR